MTFQKAIEHLWYLFTIKLQSFHSWPDHNHFLLKTWQVASRGWMARPEPTALCPTSKWSMRPRARTDATVRRSGRRRSPARCRRWWAAFTGWARARLRRCRRARCPCSSGSSGAISFCSTSRIRGSPPFSSCSSRMSSFTSTGRANHKCEFTGINHA